MKIISDVWGEIIWEKKIKQEKNEDNEKMKITRNYRVKNDYIEKEEVGHMKGEIAFWILSVDDAEIISVSSKKEIKAEKMYG